MMKFVLKGADQMKRNMQNIVKNFPNQVAQALRQEAEIEMAEAKRRTPVDTGALRASGMVQPVQQEGANYKIKLTFGGVSAPYAVYVHEDLDAFHPVGQAKFLESTLKESAPHMASRIGKRIDLNKAKQA